MRATLTALLIFLVIAFALAAYPAYQWADHGGTRWQEDVKLFFTELWSKGSGKEKRDQWGTQEWYEYNATGEKKYTP